MIFKRLFILCFIILIYSIESSRSNSTEEPGVLEKIKLGLKKAGNMLGFETASDLAQMVMETFNKVTKPPVKPSNPSAGIFSGFLRLLSFDTSKISAIVMNSFVFIAQLIVDAISPRRGLLTDMKTREVKDGTPIDWILENPSEKLKSTLNAAQDRNLPDSIIKTLKNKNGEMGGTVCTQLLICKTAPFIWKMQETITKLIEGKLNKDEEGAKGSIFAKYLPKMDDYLNNSAKCEESHWECRLTEGYE